MRSIRFLTFLSLLVAFSVHAQHTLSIDAVLDDTTHTLQIHQSIVYQNTSKDTLNEIYLTNWPNSFSSKTTPLAQHFAENFNSSFHFELDENRGRSIIQKITTKDKTPLLWERGSQLDIIRVPLKEKLLPGGFTTLVLDYSVKLPDDKFTRYGVSKFGEYKLRYWFIAPGVYDGEWQVYSNRNTDDFYMPPSEFLINFHFPKSYRLFTDLNTATEVELQEKKIVRLEGKNRKSAPIYLTRYEGFKSVVTDKLEVITDLKDKKVNSHVKALQIDRITHFLDQKLGSYPFEKLLVSDADYRNNPVYGLNQLPDFIDPFPNGFEMDMELLKTITREYLENTLMLNPRDDHWLFGALQIYLMIEYVDLYYPDTKIMGKFSNFFIVRWSHASDLEFNDQYPFIYLNTARNNLHQSLITPRDSLLKINKNLASDYYGGTGLKYLKEYIGKESLEQAIKQYFEQYVLTPSSSEDFQNVLKSNTSLPVDWFFEEYVSKRTIIDFKIKKVIEKGDSLNVTIENKRNNSMPVSLYGLSKDSIVFKTWTTPIDTSVTVTVPKEGIRKLTLNKEGTIPEFNRRNNTKKVTGLLNRPLQFRFFKDIEDPRYNQMFFMPTFSYNLYDGFSLGPKVYNKTFLPKGVHYRIEPQYGFNSNNVVGSASISYTDQKYHSDLYAVRYGISGTYRSYDTDLFYRRLSPYVTLAFRDHKDLRKNKKQYVNLRNITVNRDNDPSDPEQEPNYSVYNAQYVYSDNNLIDFYRAKFDFQLSNKFSKVSTELEYRKLFLSNRQINLRFYAGLFLKNTTPGNDDYFSFALDRPSDYLFDYNYYGRSEDQGLFSQQLIIAEGGFKSQLEPAFANDWIMTLNASTNIWKWIYAYGDIGFVKNVGSNAEVVYDTGIRASLVTDYFEVYFPLYSNLGWEPGLDRYDQKIRFIVTLDIKTLFGLFTRKWY